MGLGSELVDFYRHATSVHFGYFVIDLSPGTDDRLRFCTNTGSIPSKFYNPDRLKQSENLEDEHTKSLHSPSIPIIFHKCKNLFLQSFPEEFIRFLCECIMNLLKGNLQRIKKHHMAKFQSEVRLLPLKRTTWKQRRDILASQRGLQLIKVNIPPVINNWSLFAPVCPRSCFCVQQKFDYPVSHKAGTSKVSTFTQSHVPSWFTWEGDKQKNIFQSRLFSRQNFVLSTYQAPKITNFNFGWCRNWNFTDGLCSATASWKRRSSRYSIYFTWRRWYISDSDSESECQS